MDEKLHSMLTSLLKRYRELGIADQIDYNKFYLYSLIAHSTAIEGSTVTEIEAQLLFDEGITSSKRTIVEQMMNLDLKAAYEFGMLWIKDHPPITVDWLISLAAKVMEHTGSEYHSIGGDFSSAKGEIRKLNVTAGLGGKSYMDYHKVPDKLQTFCTELNKRRQTIDSTDIAAIYDLSFWAHMELVTIHPWADGNGRTSRLLMNLLQMEFDVLPSKVLKEDKAGYIQSLINARENDDVEIFINSMAQMHCQHIEKDIQYYLASTNQKMVDKVAIIQEMIDKWSIKPILATKMADILAYLADKSTCRTEEITQYFALSPTTTKRYLRQLVDMQYIQAQGANKNRTYSYTYR